MIPEEGPRTSMNPMRLSLLLVAALASLVLSSCETLQEDPKPERPKLSSMPHNIPAPWEGQAGLPGMMSGQY